jgi:hypothetical protein
MLNLTGDMVRRGSTLVSNTATAAFRPRGNSAKGNKKEQNQDHFDLLVGAKDKATITLKTTPDKGAITTSKLAIKVGHLMKKNEQGQWQKRFCAFVPHCYLYYYDSAEAESPRGIIDMEIFTNIQRVDNTLTCATADGSMRTYYFEDEQVRIG